MLSDEWPDFGALSPPTIGGLAGQAAPLRRRRGRGGGTCRAAGATLLRPVADQFYGDRGGMIADPFGHTWFIATPKEAVAPGEMQRRWTAASARPAPPELARRPEKLSAAVARRVALAAQGL